MKPVKLATERFPDMNIHDAYKIQEMGVRLRITGRGSVIGRKTNLYPLSFVRGFVPAEHVYKKQGEVVKKHFD